MKGGDNWDREYDKQITIRQICYCLHFYPYYSIEDIKKFTYSKLWIMMDMIAKIKNPKLLDEIKMPKMKSFEEFVAYTQDKYLG